MNIAFDAVAILGPMSKNRGIGNYALAQFREMINQDTDNQYFFFNVFEPFSLGNYENLTEEYFDCGRDRALLQVDGNRVYEALVRQFIEKNHIDIFYLTSVFDGCVPTYQKEWFDGVKTAVTAYDIIPYVMKDHYFGGVVAPSWYMECVDVLRWVDKILVISQSVKDDLIEYLDFDGSNIEVIWGASDQRFQKIEISQQQELKLREKYGIHGGFIMCTGGDDERKNIAGLIEAYAALPPEFKQQYSLAIVCKLQQASVERYTKLAQKLGIRKRLVLTNFVSDEELLQLYNLATLVAFPSKYEGFGLPVVESWACGTPVLTSNNSSLVQIAGDAAIVVDPFNVADITDGLKKALQPETLREMALRGEERLRQFQWPAVAERVIQALNHLKIAEKKETTLPHLAFFTPLPPQQAGIADYSADVITDLANYFAIDVYVDDGYTQDCVLPESVHIYNHNKYPARAGMYFDTVYQMGNSLFHYYMYPYLRRYSGTLVLHDYNMHGVGQEISLHMRNDDMKTYQKYLQEDYPSDTVDSYLMRIRRGGQVDTAMELNGFVTNYASKIIVHSRYAQEKLLEKNIGRCVSHIPLYAKIEPMLEATGVKQKIGIPSETKVLACFGHVHETKRAIPILKAGIRLLKENQEAMLVFVGKLDSAIESDFKRIVDKSRLAERIRVTGYASLQEFCDYIDAVDVCLNLRYPYNGENSGSVARVLAKGKAVVVNNVGSFSEIPDECCIKLPPVETMSASQEENTIYQTMKRLISDPEQRNRLGRCAREYAEKTLDIKIVAKQYAQFIEQKYGVIITERTLSLIREQELIPKNYSQSETRGIAKTIAYCVE